MPGAPGRAAAGDRVAGALEDVKKVLIRLELQPADVRFCVGWWPVLWSWACGWGLGGRTLGYG